MISSQCANINLLWGQLLIEELSRLGVTDICIAPGSRSTPLTIAASEHKKITTHCHFDERGLAYFALGLAKGTQKSVAIITTSGSAVANLHPALIEAKISQVPLIILSADRPDELIACGANQAISQQGIFGDSVCFQVNLPAPTLEIAAQFLLTSVDQAIEKMKLNIAPIHINCMYREPLYPQDKTINVEKYLTGIKRWLYAHLPFTQYLAGPHSKTDVFDQTVLANIESLNDKRVLIIGGQINNATLGKEIANLAQKQAWPLLLDCQSSAKGHPHAIHYYDQLLYVSEFSEKLAQADVIIQFGPRLISKRLNQFINSSKAEYWLINEGCDRLDPNHRVAIRFNMSAEYWLSAFKETSEQSPKNKRWCKELTVFDQNLSQQLEAFYLSNADCNSSEFINEISEFSVIRSLASLLPEHGLLFLGNSMPVRLFDMFCPAQQKQIQVFTNRGTSGIDGLLASALGVAHGVLDKKMTLLIGDTSLLHDLNSLALLSQFNQSFVIIVLNNDGGAIFNMLAVPEENQLRQQFYQMPHGYKFKNAAAMFNVEYYSPSSQQAFNDNYQTCIAINKPSIIEVNVPSNQTTDIVKAIGRKLNETASL